MELVNFYSIIDIFFLPFRILDSFKIIELQYNQTLVDVTALDVVFYLMVVGILISVLIKAGDWRIGR